MAFRDSPRIRRHVRGDGRESACSITTVDDAGRESRESDGPITFIRPRTGTTIQTARCSTRAGITSLSAKHRERQEPLFHVRYRTPIVLAIAIGAFNQLSGINAILYYLNDIFERAGFSALPRLPFHRAPSFGSTPARVFRRSCEGKARVHARRHGTQTEASVIARHPWRVAEGGDQG